MRRALFIPGVLLVFGCAHNKEPETTPEAKLDFVSIVTAEPPEDVFVDLMVAAAGWAKGLNGGRPTGVYQPSDADARARRGVAAATARYALRPIAPSEFGTVCRSGSNQTSIGGQSGRCTMKYVDAVIAFNSIRMGRDSGYVGLSLTRVPTGMNKSEQVYYCITLGKDGPEWKAKSNRRVADAARCLRKIP